MSDPKKPGLFRRAFRGYTDRVMRGARGAAGAEQWREARNLGTGMLANARMQACPRCLERSLVDDGGLLVCVRTDICGFEGTEADAQDMRQSYRIDPRVVTVAKGFDGDFHKRARGATLIARIMYAGAVTIGLYSLGWLVAGNPLTALWSMLVAVLCLTQGLRYAFMARRLNDPTERSVSDFLRQPAHWWV